MRRFIKTGIVLFIFINFFMSKAVYSGAYSGVESDHNDTSLYFFGAQTDDALFVSIFLGALAYQFNEAGGRVKVDSIIMSPLLGYRFDGPVSFSVAAGITVTEETRTTALADVTTKESGAVLQLGMSHYSAENNSDLLVSYNDVTEFVWSRARFKHNLDATYYLGVETFWMGNDEYQSQGLGLLFEKTGNILSGLIKLGVSEAEDSDSGFYGGLELSIPF